jgi:C-terminal processing protease CtpA/Prc
MSHFHITVTLLMLSLNSSVLSAESEATLEDAVREQYVEQVNENDLKEMAKNDTLFALDQYSHFMSEQELADIRDKRSATAFIFRVSEQVLYLRVPVFHAKTSLQVRHALEIANQQASASQIIVDLRNNRGGLLNAAIEVADEFVINGTLATTKGRVDVANLVFIAKQNDMFEGKKVAVLINKNTASAAELLAGILKFNANACVLGQNSFGKSAVQTQIPLSKGGSISLTTAVYYFSNGQTVDGQGIKPDVEISTWQNRRNPPYAIDQSAPIEWLQNSLIEKSIDCMSLK